MGAGHYHLAVPHNGWVLQYLSERLALSLGPLSDFLLPVWQPKNGAFFVAVAGPREGMVVEPRYGRLWPQGASRKYLARVLGELAMPAGVVLVEDSLRLRGDRCLAASRLRVLFFGTRVVVAAAGGEIEDALCGATMAWMGVGVVVADAADLVAAERFSDVDARTIESAMARVDVLFCDVFDAESYVLWVSGRVLSRLGPCPIW